MTKKLEVDKGRLDNIELQYGADFADAISMAIDIYNNDDNLDVEAFYLATLYSMDEVPGNPPREELIKFYQGEVKDRID